MMTESVVYDASYERAREMLNKVVELHPKGVGFLCPECGARLTIVLSAEEARKLETHPGIYCPTDSAHVLRMLHLASD